MNTSKYSRRQEEARRAHWSLAYAGALAKVGFFPDAKVIADNALYDYDEKWFDIADMDKDGQ